MPHQARTNTQRKKRQSPLRWGLGLIALLVFLLASAVGTDWWISLPEGTTAAYVGRSSCIECHKSQHQQWQNSHHDRAMDLARPETVLGNFDGVELEHFGVVSRMFRDGDDYLVRTEGRDGQLHTFQVKYVFGVEPLQQYMIEFDRPDDMPINHVARLQVLPLCWDTTKQQWFYLTPPDVRDQKLSGDDPLHWTNEAQNWNYMCAGCHSTNVRQMAAPSSHAYHTRFSEIDVSCEACHGPGSVHVTLARKRSLFWDRKLGYGLAPLKDSDRHVEVETCASCHSRRQQIFPGYLPGDNFYDYFTNDVLLPHLYHADGQILEEVYVHGSYLQSKMYHKNVRCTNCHDPHTAQLKHDGNRVCTSCHQHSSGKYDTPAHHHHQPGSSGATCVGCHMPATTYMDVDPRRDHSFRIPRPDLSVQLGTPNACSGCHLRDVKIAPAKRATLRQYHDWIIKAQTGDELLNAELEQLDQWAAEKARQWYGKPPDKDHFAYVLDAAWRGDPAVENKLIELASDIQQPGIVRASAMAQLSQFESPAIEETLQAAFGDRDTQVRLAAVVASEAFLSGRSSSPELVDALAVLLDDPARCVRLQSARALATVSGNLLTVTQHESRDDALAEHMQAIVAGQNPATAQMSFGVLFESYVDRRDRIPLAIQAYRNSIRLRPNSPGPRSNLAALLDREGREDEARQLRREELPLLAREVERLPHGRPAQVHAGVHFRYGLALYLDGQHAQSLQHLSQAVELDPNNHYFLFLLSKMHQDRKNLDEALAGAHRLLKLRPDNQMYQLFLQELRRGVGRGSP